MMISVFDRLFPGVSSVEAISVWQEGGPSGEKHRLPAKRRRTLRGPIFGFAP